VRIDSRGPVLYRGTRVGRGGTLFRMLKFRTMVVDAEKLGASSTPDDDPRLTAAGRILRRYKLDELPQLINVFRGEMSFVGPRPQVQWAVDRYTPEERALLSVRPGITDWASIKFHNEGRILRSSTDPDGDYLRLIEPEKTRLGLEYVRRRSLSTDVRIILQTVRVILSGE
jgi:lipopolysaccharide/colanic/teichoic acid biosynthesis glycosyltransferase